MAIRKTSATHPGLVGNAGTAVGSSGHAEVAVGGPRKLRETHTLANPCLRAPFVAQTFSSSASSPHP